MPTISLRDLLEGARLRTLPAAVAPVIAGAGAAAYLQAFSWGKSGLALLVALLLQIGVNFANDYSDGIRGTDEYRVGPKRLTAAGVVSPRTVLAAALSCFAFAGVCGLILVCWSGRFWLLAAGIVAVLAAWFYTGGKHPYAYLGLGLSEFMVFVFFGLLALVGTVLVQVQTPAPSWVWVAASGLGISSVALLMVNNLRDIPTDRQAGKVTLAVRLGDHFTRFSYGLCLLAAVVCGTLALVPAIAWWALPAGIALLAAAIWSGISVFRGSSGAGLLKALRNTGLFTLFTGVLEALIWVAA